MLENSVSLKNIVGLNSDYPNISKSLALYQKAQKIMHPVSQTLAKSPGQFSLGVCPIYAERGKGNRIWDVDGNVYLDFCSAIGPLSLGYAYDKVDEAIMNQLKNGISFSLIHKLEYELCELLHKIIPNAESIRISKTGADVCSAAIRISRAFTGREKILCCGYHGWHDWYISTSTRKKGIPESSNVLSETFAYNNLDDLNSKLTNEVAAVILEPFVFEKPETGYLHKVQELCRANGSLLIFDEMWTGFRIMVGGAQEYFNIIPDLAVYSKAVANGMPIALLTGREDVMRAFKEDVFFFTTFGGETLSIAAAIATIEELIVRKVPEHLNSIGSKLQKGLIDLIEDLELSDYMSCIGYPCRTMLSLSPKVEEPLEYYAYIQQELLKLGILWSKFHNLSYSFSEKDIEYSLRAYRIVLEKLKDRIYHGDISTSLLGKPLELVFRKTKF